MEITLSIALLKTLIAISECGSFSAAAERVCVSHAAVGQQMKRLEETLQVALFDRSNRTPQLNQLGKALVPRAREVVRAYETMLDDLIGEGKLFGELTLGAVPSTIRGLIPQSIKKLIQAYPELHVRVVPGVSGDLHEQIERGGLDAAVLSTPDRVGANLNWQPFVEEELVLLASPEVTEDDPAILLHSMPYIRHTRRAAVGRLAEEWLQEHEVTVRPSMEMESLETLSSMVSHNLGISIVPNICVPDPIFEKLRKIPLHKIAHGKRSARTLGILTRADCTKMRLVARLLDEIKITVSDSKKHMRN
ncbi:MAG: LysR family transcriptional regulator [Stappiaceae bacterium]